MAAAILRRAAPLAPLALAGAAPMALWPGDATRRTAPVNLFQGTVVACDSSAVRPSVTGETAGGVNSFVRPHDTYVGKMHRRFPAHGRVDRETLRMTHPAWYSMVALDEGPRIGEEIRQTLGRNTGIRVIDGTACTGGSCLALAKDPAFESVTSIELDAGNFEALKHNVATYAADSPELFGPQRVRLIHGDLTKEILKLVPGQADAIYFGPPWGGPGYKKEVLLDLDLSGVDVSEVVNELRHRVKVIVVKVPYNFNFRGFARRIVYRSYRVTLFGGGSWSHIVIDTSDVDPGKLAKLTSASS